MPYRRSLPADNRIRARLVEKAQTLQPTNLASTAKRMLWLCGMTYGDLSAATGMSQKLWSNVCEGHQRFTPGALDRFLDAVGAPPAQRTHLHRMAAMEAGWKL